MELLLFISVGDACVMFLVVNCCYRRQQYKRLEELLQEILESNNIVHIHVYNFQKEDNKYTHTSSSHS